MNKDLKVAIVLIIGGVIFPPMIAVIFGYFFGVGAAMAFLPLVVFAGFGSGISLVEYCDNNRWPWEKSE